MSAQAPGSWPHGYTLLLIAPFIGLPTVLFDLPWWANLLTVVIILTLVFFGSRMFFSRRGGWRPSQTLPEQPHDPRPEHER